MLQTGANEYVEVQHLSCHNIQEHKVLNFFERKPIRTITLHNMQVTLSGEETLIGDVLLKKVSPRKDLSLMISR